MIDDILFWVLILLLVVASIITIIMFLIVSKRFREHENNGDTSDKVSAIDIHNPPNRGSHVMMPHIGHVHEDEDADIVIIDGVIIDGDTSSTEMYRFAREYEEKYGIYLRIGENHLHSTCAEKSHPTNCKNCGAVLHSNTCEFCGTEYT